MFHFIVLFGLVSVCLVGFAAARLLVRAGGWTRFEGAALAVGLAVAPVLTGLLSYPAIAMGWAGVPLALFPGAVASLVLLMAGWPPHPVSLIKPLRGCPVWISVLAAVATTLVIIQGLSIALIENDAMEYVLTGRIMSQRSGLGGYPFVKADSLTGFYAPSLHPPAFHLLIAWVIGAAPEGSLLTLRVACVMALISTGLAAAHMATSGSTARPTLTLLLILTTPILVSMGTSFNADAPRIAALTAALLATTVALERPCTATTIACGVVCAVAMWAHGAGLIAPVVAFVALALSVRTLRETTRLGVFLCTAIIVGGAWYMGNLSQFGTVIKDSWPASEWEFLGYGPDMLARRGLGSMTAALTNGAMQAFTNIALMGVAFWLALLGMLFHRPKTMNPGEVVAAVAVLGFLVAGCVSAMLGRDVIVKNIRYVLSIAPAAAIIASGVLAAALEKTGLLRFLARAICVMAFVWSSLSIGIRSFGLTSANPLLGKPETWAITRERFSGGPLLGQIQSSPGDRLLTFRQADLVHRPDLRWIDHFDPVLMDVHTFKPSVAAAHLSGLGVRLIYVPASTPVTLLNSALGGVIGDPTLAEPVADHRGTRLLRLYAVGTGPSCGRELAFASDMRHRRPRVFDQLVLLTRLPQIGNFLSVSEPSTAAPLPVEIGREQDSSELKLTLTAPYSGRFGATLRLSGRSLFSISAELRDEAGRSRNIPLLDGLAPADSRDFLVQWTATAGEQLVALTITRPAGQSSPIRLDRATMCAVDR